MTPIHHVVFEEVQILIQTVLKIPKEQITLSTNIADLTDDSIQLFELLMAFEKKYETQTTYEDVVKLRTVGDVVEYVSRIVYKNDLHA